MTIHLPSSRMMAALVLSLATSGQAMAASPPSPAQALRIKPVQKDVEYDTPNAADVEKCTIKPEKIDAGVQVLGEVMRETCASQEH